MIPQELTQFLEDLQKESAIEREAFIDLIRRSATVLRLSDMDLADTFTISRPSVTRWRNGVSVPHQALRRPVLDYLEKQAKTAIKSYERYSPEKQYGSGGRRGSGSMAAGSR